MGRHYMNYMGESRKNAGYKTVMELGRVAFWGYMEISENFPESMKVILVRTHSNKEHRVSVGQLFYPGKASTRGFKLGISS